jgi:hypothetical protein
MRAMQSETKERTAFSDFNLGANSVHPDTQDVNRPSDTGTGSSAEAARTFGDGFMIFGGRLMVGGSRFPPPVRYRDAVAASRDKAELRWKRPRTSSLVP